MESVTKVYSVNSIYGAHSLPSFYLDFFVLNFNYILVLLSLLRKASGQRRGKCGKPLAELFIIIIFFFFGKDDRDFIATAGFTRSSVWIDVT